jgi:hypothetical protein
VRTKSKLAVTSLVLGVAGTFLALSHTPLLLVLAARVGVAAVATGVVALWSVRRARGAMPGGRMAVAGACLGGGASIFSLVALGLMLWQFISRQAFYGPSSQDWQQTGRQFIPEHPMPDEPATNFTSNLPIVLLETGGRDVEKQTKTFARAAFFEVENGRASLHSRTNYDGFAMLHLHGTSSLRLPKQSYGFQAVDRNTNQAKVALLGLPKDDAWILYAPFEDKTMIRDVLGYELASRMGRYGPRTKYVELFVNHSSRPLSMEDYAGVYVLVERIKRGKERVNIAKVERDHRSEPEITGGYIFKRDHIERRGDRFQTSRSGPYFYVHPKAEDMTREQKTWLEHYLEAFESALYGEEFADPAHGYAAYLDVDSFIDAHWLIEASKNVDGFRYSAFLTKDRGGKLKPEPPWDWNRSFGNANYYGGWQVQDWHWPRLRPNELSWYRRLKQDPEFDRRCARRWRELRQDVFNPQQLTARVDELAAQLDEAQKRNFQRWPILGHQITCNYYVGSSYVEEVRWLKRWMVGRIAWIDSQLDGAGGAEKPLAATGRRSDQSLAQQPLE